MTRFRTLVFMDTETTGLPGEMTKKDVQITEISMLAVHTNRFEEKLKPPRVLSKLSLCIQPRSIVSPMAMEITGLFNSNLEHEPLFDQSTGLLIKQFLERFELPLCLLAHNGSRFDFPVLRAELERVEVALPGDVYCMDTLTAFQVLLEEEHQLSKSYRLVFTGKKSEEKEPCTQLNSSLPDSQFDIFSTPKRSDTFDFVPSSSQVFRARKRLNFSPSQSESEPKIRRQYFGVPKFWPRRLKGFRLQDVYKKVLNDEMVDAHQAEADTVALLEVSRHVEGFLEFIEYNAKSFDLVEPMWTSTPAQN